MNFDTCIQGQLCNPGSRVLLAKPNGTRARDDCQPALAGSRRRSNRPHRVTETSDGVEADEGTLRTVREHRFGAVNGDESTRQGGDYDGQRN